MAASHAPGPDAVPIGDVAAPPFVRLPNVETLFQSRAERLRWLGRSHELSPYLLFLASLCDIQHQLQAELPQPALPDTETLHRAREFGMPPLDRERLACALGLMPWLERLAALSHDLDMPEAARAALTRVSQANEAQCDAMISAVLAPARSPEMLAEHSFVAAALQVHFARLAAALDATSLRSVGDGACPSCGYPPVASMVVGWLGSHGARYCGCALCGTLWHTVRIKCTLCGSTKGIAYQEIDGGNGLAKAETCTECHRYVKILQQDKDPAVDVLADDVANLGLDLLMSQTGFRRGGVNPFLLGY